MISNFTPIQRRGVSGSTGTANSTLVTSGANVNGVFLRSFYLWSAPGAESWLEIGGVNIHYTTGFGHQWNGLLFIPAGNALAVGGTGGVFRWGATWDAL